MENKIRSIIEYDRYGRIAKEEMLNGKSTGDNSTFITYDYNPKDVVIPDGSRAIKKVSTVINKFVPVVTTTLTIEDSNGNMESVSTESCRVTEKITKSIFNLLGDTKCSIEEIKRFKIRSFTGDLLPADKTVLDYMERTVVMIDSKNEIILSSSKTIYGWYGRGHESKITYKYDENCRIVGFEDSVTGLFHQYVYDKKGRVIEEYFNAATPDDCLNRYNYKPNVCRVITAYNKFGGVVSKETYSYGPTSNYSVPVKISTLKNKYDKSYRLIKSTKTSYRGKETVDTFEYLKETDLIVRHVRDNAIVIENEYDNYGRLIRDTTPLSLLERTDDRTKHNRVTEYTYHDNGMLFQEKSYHQKVTTD